MNHGTKGSPEHAALLEALRCFDSNQSEFARALSEHRVKRGATTITQSLVYDWLNRAYRAPPRVCKDIQDLTGVSVQRLRGDVF